MMPGAPTARPAEFRRRRRFGQYPDRIRAVEAALAQCVPEPQIRHKFSAQFGVSEKMVNAYMREVRARWAEDAAAAGGTSRDVRRDEIRLFMKAIAIRAVTGEAEDDGTGKTRRGKPNLRVAILAAKGIRELDGLDDAPPEVNLNQHNYYVNGQSNNRMGFKDDQALDDYLEQREQRVMAKVAGDMHSSATSAPLGGDDDGSKP